MLKRLLDGLFRSGSYGKGGAEAEALPATLPVTEYRDCLITPDPQSVSGQYRVSGWIRKPVAGGETLEHRFERSDMVGSREACIELSVRKAERLIDDLGDQIFEKR